MAGVLLGTGALLFWGHLPSDDDAINADGFVDPQAVAVDFSEEHDRTIDVPGGSDTVILAAPGGSAYTVRFEADGHWSDWSTVHATVEEGPDSPDDESQIAAGRPVAIGPIRLASNTTKMQVVSVLGDPLTVDAIFLSDQPGTAALAVQADQAAQATDSDADTGAPQALVASARQVAEPAQPPIQPRSAWATEGWAYGTAGCENGPRYASSTRALVVHHTVSTNNYGPDEVDDLIRAVYYAHVHINGWCDVGYNFLVDRFGTIWEGRSGGVARPVIGGHAKGFNTNTVGVAMLGQHHPSAQPAPTRPTAATQAAIAALATWKFQLHGIDPAGTTWLKNTSTRGAQRLASDQWHLVPTVVGHRDVGATACPGDYGITTARAMPGALRHVERTVPQAKAWNAALSGPGFVTLDSRGGLRPAGSVALPGIGQPGQAELLDTDHGPVAVAAVRVEGKLAGYALDSAGGLHPFGHAPAIATGSWAGKTVVDISVSPGGDNEPTIKGGWVATTDGQVHHFGAVAATGTTSDQRSALGGRVVAASIDVSGAGYLLGANGRLAAVGDARSATASLPTGERPVDVTLRGGQASSGGWVLGANGSLTAFGGAPAAGITANAAPGDREFVAIAPSEAGIGGWALTADGLLWPFGGAAQVSEVYTDAATVDAIDTVAVSFALPPNFAQTSEGKYTTQLLGLFLGRTVAPTDDIYLRWGAQVVSGVPRLTVTEALARSPEWAGVQVDKVYQDVLGRAPDSDGRAYWLSQIEQGMPLQGLGVYFYGSAEFFSRSGSAEAFVTRLYRALLEREPDRAGLLYWTNLLNQGRAAPDDVAAGFYASIESRRQRVEGLYQQVLGRAPDSNGLDHWAHVLLTDDDVKIAAFLAASDEFYQRSVGS